MSICLDEKNIKANLMGIKKSIRKILSEPSEMRLQEVTGILLFLGYRLERSKGSHFQFTKDNQQVLTIASHHQKVKKIYLRTIKEVIIEMNLKKFYE